MTPLSKDLSGSSTLGTLFSSEDEDPIYAAEHFPKRKYRRRRRKNKLKKKKRPGNLFSKVFLSRWSKYLAL